MAGAEEDGSAASCDAGDDGVSGVSPGSLALGPRSRQGLSSLPSVPCPGAAGRSRQGCGRCHAEPPLAAGSRSPCGRIIKPEGWSRAWEASGRSQKNRQEDWLASITLPMPGPWDISAGAEAPPTCPRAPRGGVPAKWGAPGYPAPDRAPDRGCAQAAQAAGWHTGRQASGHGECKFHISILDVPGPSGLLPLQPLRSAGRRWAADAGASGTTGGRGQAPRATGRRPRRGSWRRPVALPSSLRQGSPIP